MLFPVTVISAVAGNAPPLRATKTLTVSPISAPFEALSEVLEICTVAVTPVYPLTAVEARSSVTVPLLTCHDREPPRIRWLAGASPAPVVVEIFPLPALIVHVGVAGDVSKS